VGLDDAAGLNSGAEGMMVLVEFAWLRSIPGAGAPPPSPFRTRKTSDNSIRCAHFTYAIEPAQLALQRHTGNDHKNREGRIGICADPSRCCQMRHIGAEPKLLNRRSWHSSLGTITDKSQSSLFPDM
jgi:hypothetical protein